MKLIGMTDFVLNSKSELHYFKVTQNYANFLKQPLELWMFIPLDKDGNVLEEPDQNNTKYDVYISNDEVDCNYGLYDEDCLEYQKSKERCLFGIYSFEGEDDNLWYFSKNEITLTGIDKFKTIEDIIDFEFELTKTAEKLIGL